MRNATLIMVVLAGASLAGAVAMRPQVMPPPTFEDSGEELFPEFQDPNAAASLEVKAYDQEQAQVTSFSVKLQDGLWVIPSHNDYPADGTERMGKAAVSFLGAKKDVVRSDDPKDHAEFGVLDPEGSEGEGEERGQRVTIKDASDSVLVDVIIGKDVPDKQGFKFVRYPGQNRVYAAKIAPEISTQFTDWIEKDLLKLDQDGIVALRSNSYSVDEKSGTVTGDNPLYFEHVDSGAMGADGNPTFEWTLTAQPIYGPDGELVDLEALAEQMAAQGQEMPPLPKPPEIPAGKELNPSKITQVLGAADRLKIVGVRPQPERLNAIDLLSKGFFVGGEPPNQRLFGNEGELALYADDGVIYTLYFGEVTYASGEVLTAGGEGELETDAEGEGEGEAADKGAANRYMFVSVGYDERRDLGSADAPVAGELRGRDRAEALAERFNKWFYVIPDSSFTQLHKLPDDFWRDVKPE
ncbi:DUF4340 domain-containing protein [Pseudenhygromyxa sp. WMMC2535]|uniref:DUF4340 domain-containing protein n=1 Tax=Pseudenhygromyxa sp. WMMC2535 TaxID=2712867 RepID=UPI0015522E3E|nr:DUF4340 domain-containing protein [Pseudenhygromyxa sp. WMMC2535]NVB42109.1 DUF4340 domain-containing protein [Pseudenhygromyxa sp. WMMC2535]